MLSKDFENRLCLYLYESTWSSQNKWFATTFLPRVAYQKKTWSTTSHWFSPLLAECDNTETDGYHTTHRVLRCTDNTSPRPIFTPFLTIEILNNSFHRRTQQSELKYLRHCGDSMRIHSQPISSFPWIYPPSSTASTKNKNQSGYVLLFFFSVHLFPATGFSSPSLSDPSIMCSNTTC